MENNELKTKLISDYIDQYSQEYIDSQVETETVILETFEQLMNEFHKNSKEYKNAKSEYDKQVKVLEYFKSASFAELYKEQYKKEMEVLKLNKDLATSQLTALRAQMNPHFLFNAMNSIQQFTLTNDIENANLYISKFSTLLRKVLYLSQQSFITLEEELLQLELYLEIEKLRLGIEFSYFIQKETDLEVDAIYIPGMLIQPFVENALKQGLAPKIGDKILKIEISLPELDILKIIITDNGIGRQKANELKLRQEKLLPYISKGLKLVEERLQLIAGKPAFDLFHFKDNFDDNGQAIGTTVTLTIPVASTNI